MSNRANSIRQGLRDFTYDSNMKERYLRYGLSDGFQVFLHPHIRSRSEKRKLRQV